MHSGHLLAQSLADHGVTHVFGIPGPQLQPLYDAIGDSDGALTHVLVRDERSAAYAADAFARVSGRLAVCDAMSGPGFVKFASGLAEAQTSSVPLIALAGDAPRNQRHLAGYGATPQVLPNQAALLAPLTKESISVDTQEGLASSVRRAFAVATSGRPGPVMLNIPQDVMEQEWDPQAVPVLAHPAHGCFPSYRVRPSQDSIAAAARVLLAAQRPVLVVGGGGLLAGGQAQILALAEALSIPVATTLTGKGVFPENHHLAAGVFGSQYGEPFTATVVAEADTVFLIGFKSAQRSTEHWTLPRRDQHVIHLDIDAAEIGKVFATEVGIVCDASAGLTDLLTYLELERPTPIDRGSWTGRVAELRSEWRVQAEEESISQSPILPQQIMKTLDSMVGADTILVSDASLAGGWLSAFTHTERTGRRYLYTRGTGGLGFALPASIGAAFASPGTRIVALAGDGGFGYSLAELSTCVKYNLPIVSIVLNNSAFGYSSWLERVGRGAFENTDFPPTDFAAIARGFGATGIRVEEPGDLESALSDAMTHEGPVVLDVVTDRWAVSDLAIRRLLAAGALPI